MSLIKGPFMCFRIFPALSLIYSIISIPADLPADTVQLTDGSSVQGEISKETVKGISIRTSGRTRNIIIPLSEIVPNGTIYDEKPLRLEEAENDLRSSEYSRAFSGFKAVIQLTEGAAKNGNRRGGVRPIFHQHALYGQIKAVQGMRNVKNTLAAIDILLKYYPDTMYLQEVLLLKIRMAAASGDASAVNGAIQEAEAQAKTAGAGAEISDQIQRVQAELLERGGKKAEALKIWQALAQSRVKEVEEVAKLKVAENQLEKGDMIQAKITFNELLRRSKSRSVLCGAAVGLGDTQIKEMEAINRTSADGLRDALESYLEAVVLHFPAPGDSPLSHQDALVKAAQCAEKLMKVDGKNSEGYLTVTRDLYRDIKSTYPQSEWAKKADVALQRLSETKTQ